ncbi:MAG: hypothetical protein MH204_07045 [Fimbriimonadaceae bacterium]|nr:hypothetical protein [Fimbriimonadaceae bacterium]
MKTSAILALLPLGSAALAAPIQMKVTVEGGPTGMVTLDQTILSTGAKQISMTLRLRQDGKVSTVVQESIYDKAGRPIRQIQRTLGSDGRVVQMVRADFLADIVEVTLGEGSQRAARRVPMPGRRILAEDEFWIIRDRPRPGTTVNRSRFDLARQEWVDGSATYVGLQTVDWGGRKVQAHLIRTDDAQTWLDVNGNPLRVIRGKTRLERVS